MLSKSENNIKAPEQSVIDILNSEPPTAVPVVKNHKVPADNFWKTHIEDIVELSYDPVPIKHMEKRPLIKGWPGTDFTTAAKLEKYSHTPHGVGIKTASTPAIDIDVRNTTVAGKIVSAIKSELDGKILCRIGQSPKLLIPCQIDGVPFGKITTAKYKDPTKGHDAAGKPIYHQVEILSSGQQFVAFGIHPKTKAPYRWRNGSPADTRVSELPKLSQGRATSLCTKIEAIFEAAGFIKVSDGNCSGNSAYIDDLDIDPKAQALVAQALGMGAVMNSDLDLPVDPYDDRAATKAADAINHIDFSKLNHDDCVRLIAGAKHGSNADPRILKLLDEQASKDNKRGSSGYQPGYIEQVWDSVSVGSHSGPNGPATLGTVYKTAIDHGWDEHAYTASVTQKPISIGAALNFRTPIKPGDFPHAKANSNGHYSPVVKCTIENVEHLLSRYGITARFDVITKRHQFTGNGMPDDTRTGGAALAVNARLESLATLCGIAPSNMQKMANNISMDNPINPVVDYLSTLKWDGTDHIKNFAGGIVTDKADTRMRNEIIKLFIIQACAAADWAEKTPNKDAKPKFEYIPVLYSAQGVQKTKFWNELAPARLRKYFADGLHLDPGNTDSVRNVIENWIVELGELDSTFKASDISRLKAFTSSGIDTFRTPYDRVAGSYQRRTVMCGSVNQCDFLRDRTGSRRFWPIQVQSITLPSTTSVNLDQVWAQGWHLYMTGQQWWPTPAFESVLDIYREQFSMDDIMGIGEALTKYFQPLTVTNKAKPGSTKMSVTEIYSVLFPSDFSPSPTSVRALSKHLEQYNKDAHGTVDRKNHQGTHKWRMPPRL